MNTLNSLPFVRESLRSGKKESVANRKRLREFQGFNFDERDKQYVGKCQYIDKNLTQID